MNPVELPVVRHKVNNRLMIIIVQLIISTSEKMSSVTPLLSTSRIPIND